MTFLIDKSIYVMDNLYKLTLEFLIKRGIKPNEDKDTTGICSFSVNGLNFICETNESDPHFFRLILPKINNPNTNFPEINEECHRLNRIFKVAKIIQDPDNSLWVYADLFIYSVDNFELLLDRVIQAMTDMIKEYHSIEIKKNNGNI